MESEPIDGAPDGDDEQTCEPTFVMHPAHKAQQNKAIMLLLFFSFMMFSLPFVAFYGTKFTLEDYNITGFTNVIWSVSAAVSTVYLIIGGYVYIAYKEQEYDEEGRPIDNKPKAE